MSYSQEEIEEMEKKLKELKDLLSFQIDMGEDTSVVMDKISELENILENKE